MSVQIIVDSAADMDRELVERERLLVIPLKTIFGEEEYLDGVTITPLQFYEKLIEDTTHHPSTSQPSPYEFQKIFEQATEHGDSAVVITISGKLSGTYQNAMIAANDFSGQIYVVDSENVTIGEQLLVQLALRLRAEGLDAAAIAAQLEQKKQDICLIALLNTLEYLKRGGRISSTAAFAGSLLSIKPVISIEDGEVNVIGKARGSKNGYNMLTEFIDKKGGIDFAMPISLGYTGHSDALLQKYIKDNQRLWRGNVDKLPVTLIGSTIGTHAGPGAIAVAFFSRAAVNN